MLPPEIPGRGLVVKAVDEISRKRKAERMESPNGSVKTSRSSSVVAAENGAYQLGMLPPEIPVAFSELDDDPGRDSLMPKERCPVCSIEITHKNLARHIKLRHGIRYKFCHKCRKLVPNQLYPEHKAQHDAGQLESVSVGVGDKQLEFIDGIKTDEDEDEAIEIPEEMLDQALDINNSGSSRRKDDNFRANTSMTKLESLMGKEFKHPRRKCQICGYSVSYSNFKRHLRNAHPGELTDEQVNQEGGEEMMGHHMDDSDRVSYNAIAYNNEGESKNDIVEGYSECKKCGDHVMKEFMPRHMRMMHGEDASPTVVKGASPRPRNIIMRACPECGVEMRSDSITKHCKIKHKVSYRYCTACAKYIQKKYFKSHLRKHESGELTGDLVQEDEENEDGDLDTSKDDEDEKDVDEEESNDVPETVAAKAPNKIYNCVDCTRMFMSAEAHANHLREVHGGEGGSVVLKLPGDKLNDNKKSESDEQMEENDEENMDDDLVIDDS